MRAHPRTTKLARVAAVALGAATLLSAASADAFCGFYVGGADHKLFNNATQVVLMRDGTRTVLSMQNNYQGPPEAFALVVPVPVVLQKDNVKTLARDVFDRVDQLGAPRLVEYWEQDPCWRPPRPRPGRGRAEKASALPPPSPAAAAEDRGVKIEAQYTVGEYEIVILSAKDASGLDTWLREAKYSIPEGASAYLKPYVERGSKFFVAKVDPTKVKFEGGMATLSPLRFHYDDETFALPIRLGLMNADKAQDLIVSILARSQRYEVANYPNVTIPTNLDVAERAREEFGSFYAALFDRTLEKNPKAVVTEYAWATGTCDPCPGPAMGPNDLVTLGGDVLPGVDCSDPYVKGDSPYKQYRPECQPWMRYRDFVITRLHARYTKESLGEDLVFKKADAIVGGREIRKGDGSLEHGATTAPQNNFQARYAIRHPWTGPVACANPRRGVWGGPPHTDGTHQAPPKPAAARNLAFAPRGKTSLASYVRSDIPELGTKGDPDTATVSGVSSSGKSEHKGRSRCGCRVPGGDVGSTAPAGVALGLAAALTARVSRRRRAARDDRRRG
ncbi:MAG: DUF2330 domain-containing protein [Polyangiaceae bacterium]